MNTQHQQLEKKLVRPTQAIVIENLLDQVAISEHLKDIYIEKDWIDYVKGLAVLCCPPNELCLLVNIFDVRHCLADEITEQEYKENGFVNYQEMLATMKENYRDFNDKTKITLTRWKNLDFGIIQ